MGWPESCESSVEPLVEEMAAGLSSGTGTCKPHYRECGTGLLEFVNIICILLFVLFVCILKFIVHYSTFTLYIYIVYNVYGIHKIK